MKYYIQLLIAIVISIGISIIIIRLVLPNSDNNATPHTIDDIMIRLDSLYLLHEKTVSILVNKIDSIESINTTIIHNHETFENAVIDGSISDDSIAIFIAREIQYKRQQLLLLPD